MSEARDSQTSSPGTGGSKSTGGKASLSQKIWIWLVPVGRNTDGGVPVGPLGIILAVVFLIVVTVSLLYGITNQWPVCDLQDENPNANANTNPNSNANSNGNSNANEGANVNANRGALPPANANTSGTPGANANVATNANVSTNANTNTPANRSAGAGAGPNTNTSANVASPASKASPGSTTDETKLDADTIEPTSGPITGKTLVTIKGKNFGSKKDDIKVKFGEADASINQVTDKTISVTTPRHSEGLVDVTVTKGAEKDMLTSAYTYTCPPPSGRGLFIMLIMAGALGGCIHALRSLYWYAGQGELKWRWMPMYVALPFMGAAMAMIFSLLIFAGFVDQTAGKSQALFIIAVAGLVGMFSQQAALKLTDVANAFFTKPGEGENAKPQQSLSVGQTPSKPSSLTATTMTPEAGKAAGQEEVKIMGSGFNTSTSVTFGGVTAKIKGFDATSITVVTPGQGAGAADVDVVVTSGDQSVKLPIKFKYT